MKGAIIMNKEKQNIEQELVQFLQEARGNILDIFYDVYEQFFKSNKSPQCLLHIIFEFAEEIGTDVEESTKVSDEIQEAVENQLLEIKGIVLKIAEENPSPDIFYANLWNELFASSSVSQNNEHCAVLLKMLNEDVPILPYYQASNLCHMEDSDFKASLQKIRSQIVESTHMLNRHFDQKTETVSQLCRIANGLPQEDMYVYWATIISVIEKSSYRAGHARAISDIKKRLSEDTEDE